MSNLLHSLLLGCNLLLQLGVKLLSSLDVLSRTTKHQIRTRRPLARSQRLTCASLFSCDSASSCLCTTAFIFSASLCSLVTAFA